MTTRANKKVQYRYHGKNCLVSDHTERTLCEIYSHIIPISLGQQIWFKENKKYVVDGGKYGF